MRKDEGIILIVTLFMLFLLTLFVLSGMKNLFLYSHTLNQAIEKEESEYDLEFHARQLAIKSWKEGDRCTAKEQKNNKMLPFLKKEGCNFIDKNKKYTYLVEDLGVFPCLQNEWKGHLYSTQHWRISIFSEAIPTVMQLRIAQRTSLLTCSFTVRQFPVGILSVHYRSFNLLAYDDNDT